VKKGQEKVRTLHIAPLYYEWKKTVGCLGKGQVKNKNRSSIPILLTLRVRKRGKGKRGAVGIFTRQTQGKGGKKPVIEKKAGGKEGEEIRREKIEWGVKVRVQRKNSPCSRTGLLGKKGEGGLMVPKGGVVKKKKKKSEGLQSKPPAHTQPKREKDTKEKKAGDPYRTTER